MSVASLPGPSQPIDPHRTQSATSATGINIHTIAALIFAAILSFHAAFRGTKSDFDAEGYSIWLERIAGMTPGDFISDLTDSNLYFSSDVLFSFETGFAILTFLITRISSNIEIFFFCTAFLGLSLKALAINQFCTNRMVALAWYASWSYLLLEMTTIRAGISSGLLLLSYGALRDRRHINFLLWVGLASTFHASSIVALALPLVHVLKQDRKRIGLFLICAIGLSFFSILPVIEALSLINSKILEYYDLYNDLGLYDSINKFNAVVLARIAILVASLCWVLDKTDSEDGMLDAALFVFPIALYYSTASFPLIGGRLYELFGIFQVFLISRIFSTKWPPLKILAVAVILLQFYTLVFHIRFVDFFYFVGQSYNIETSHRR